MADRYPLIANSETNRIEELAAGDNLNLTGSGIVGATTVTADKFIGDLEGIAQYSTALIDGSQILSGTISSERLAGYYNIGVNTAKNLESADNILSGTISTARLAGDYNINITGTAQTALYLEDASNILDGIISADRLSGVYNIDITGTAFQTEITELISVGSTDTSVPHYISFFNSPEGTSSLYVDAENLTYNPGLNRLGIGTSEPETNLDVIGDVSVSETITANAVVAATLQGLGESISGIVTQITAGIGVNVTPTNGKGNVKIDSYRPTGKTIFVNQNGDDNNTGLSENHAKRTIKAAANVAVFGDTIKVYPGVYVEENPIILKKTVSVEGTELRNCVVTPRYPYLDLFQVNNGCHITDLSFIGPDMTDGASVVSLQPLEGVAVDRYFDAARMIRLNLDYIAKETVGFLTSGFSGFAGNHREQDAARLIDKNIDYIAAEAIGYLTSPQGLNFNIPFPGTTEDCADDIKDIFRSVSYDLKANSNKKSIGAALSYFGAEGELLHITGAGVSEATISTLEYAVGIAYSVINNTVPPQSYQIGVSSVSQVIDPSVILVEGGCVAVGNTISQLVGIITSAIGIGNTETLPNLKYGVTLESGDCSDDIKDVWKCIIHDITRGGNSRCVDAGKAYYDNNWNLIPQILKNPGEVEQTVASIDYSFNVARAIINNVTWGGYPIGDKLDVIAADYNEITGITTITVNNHGLSKDDSIKINDLEFTCPSGPGIVTYPSGSYGYIFNVLNIIDDDRFEVVVGQSTLPHTYSSGGKIQKYTSFQNNFYQVKDLSIQSDPLTGFNDAINGCANVVSALHSCVGIVTNIVGFGSDAFNVVGIKTSYPGNSGIGFTSTVGIQNVIYDETSGKATIFASGLNVKVGEPVEIRDLTFSCGSTGNISTQVFPSGVYGYDFTVDKINDDESFDVYVGPSTLPHTYVGGGIIVDRSVAVTTSTYDHTTGIATIMAEGLSIETGDLVSIRGLEFSCESGAGTTTIYPTGNQGYNFRVLDIVVDKPIAVTTAVYDNVTGIATITAPGISVDYNGLVELRNLEFTCPDSPPNLLYPSGNNGYLFRVLSSVDSIFTVNVGPSTIPHTYVSGGTVIDRSNTANDTFTIQVGPSTIPHNYVSGGIVIPPYSRGVGNITQGPYVRNCTNFIPKSIGMKIDGFAAEPGDQDDIGVTGTMSVDSYTQYNQGGIGVSITNGAYAQLVSIFTICDDIAIFTGSGGQCDITNSNSSFGRYGLVSDGVGDNKSSSIYRYSGRVHQNADSEQATIIVSGIGSYRPYDGQAIYFGDLYYSIQRIEVVDGGSGYSNPPSVIISAPEGENGIIAEGISNIENGKVVSIDLISTGTQYLKPPSITLIGDGDGASAVAKMAPIYYTIESASLPSSGISTIILNNNLNSSVSAGTTVYFNRLSLQITSSHSFEWVGSGNDIFKAKPSLGGVVTQENEVVKIAGGEIVYTSTDQAGNFRIGDGVVVNQLTGTISGRAFSQSLLNTVTPLIIALG